MGVLKMKFMAKFNSRLEFQKFDDKLEVGRIEGSTASAKSFSRCVPSSFFRDTCGLELFLVRSCAAR